MAEARGRYVVWATDRAGGLAQRHSVREPHRARLRNPAPHDVSVLLGGPTLDAAGQMNGTMLVVEALDLDAVRAFVADDPYVLQGVYDDVEIRPWRCGLGPLSEPASNQPSSS